MGLFPKVKKYQRLDVHHKRNKSVISCPRMLIYGLFALSVILIISLVLFLFLQFGFYDDEAKSLDFVLFGPRKESPDLIRVSEHRALAYALASPNATNRSSRLNVTYGIHKAVSDTESYIHVNKKYNLVCYYGMPSRTSQRQYLSVANLDANLCSHLILFFLTVENNTVSRPNANDSEVFKEVLILKEKNPELKILVSVMSFSAIENAFSDMVASKINRKQFVSSALSTLTEYSLDGLDLDWEFPAWPPMQETAIQKQLFVELIKELREAFGSKYILSVAVAAPFVIIRNSYDVPSMAKYVDFINVMSYDFHYFVWYLPIVGPNAPLYESDVDSGYFSTLNTNFSVNYWLSEGMPKSKINVGVPTYGHSWTLLHREKHGYGDVATGFGRIGEKGFVSYRDVCNFKGLADTGIVFDKKSAVPYAFNQNEWFSFDNELSVSYKAEYVAENGLAGVMIYSLNYDDFEGDTCNKGSKYPLVNQVKKVLRDNML